MKILKLGLLFLVVLMLIFTVNGIANEIDYPSKPITMWIPYDSGGHTDISARVLAKAAAEILGQPIVIENKPGGGGTVALTLLKDIPPDGYTIGILPTSALERTPHILEVDYDPFEDFSYIMKYGLYAVHVSVMGDSQYKKFEDIIESARKNPGGVSYSVPGPMDGGVIVMEHIAELEGVTLNAVPYTSTADAKAALLGGHVDAFVASGITSNLTQIAKGEIAVLACVNSIRTPILGDVPTLKELGYNVAIDSGIGVGAPKGISEEIRKKLEDAFIEATKDPDFQDLCNNKIYMPLNILTGDEFKKSVEADYKTLGDILDRIGLTAN